MAQSRVGSSGNKVLAELSQDPVARKNKYDTLKRQFDALERRADYLATRLEANQTRGNQGAYNAIVQQLQDTESRINSLATEMNSIAEASRYRAQEDRKQQRIDARKPKTTMEKVRESLPYQIGSGIRDMIVDTGKGIGQTALYGENAIRNSTLGKNDKGFTTLQFGKAGTQGSVMNPEDITMGDIADTYIKEGAKTAGTYADFLNSLAYRGFTGRGKPDSEDGRFNKMIGERVPRVFGTKDIEDPTVAKGAEVIVDPLAILGGAVKGAKVTAKAIDEFGDIAKGFRRADGKYVPMDQAGMFIPITPMRMAKNPKAVGVDVINFEDAYQPVVRDAYKKYKELKSKGLSKEEIFKQTRVFEGVDGIPYFETNDQLLKIDIPAIKEAWKTGKDVNMKDVINHPELDDLDYILQGNPIKNNQQIKILPQNEQGGTFNFQTGELSIDQYAPDDEFLKTTAHELNHMVSGNRGVQASGTNLNIADNMLSHNYPNIANQTPEFIKLQEKSKQKAEKLYIEFISLKNKLKDMYQSGINSNNQAEAIDIMTQAKKKEKEYNRAYAKYSNTNARQYKPVGVDYNTKFDTYESNMGETMSRLTESRLNLPIDMRENLYPLNPYYMQAKTGYKPDQLWYAKYGYQDDINKGVITDQSDNKLREMSYKMEYPEKIKQDIIKYLMTGKAVPDFIRQRK